MLYGETISVPLYCLEAGDSFISTTAGFPSSLYELTDGPVITKLLIILYFTPSLNFTSAFCIAAVGLTIEMVIVFLSAFIAADISRGYVSLPDETSGLSTPIVPLMVGCLLSPSTDTGIVPK